jgi:protein-tyrosine phosphatase
MISSSRMARGAAVTAAATLVAVGGGTAVAAVGQAPAGQAARSAGSLAFSRIPFSSASVTANASAGTLGVSWNAPYALGVAVYAGTTHSAQTHYLGFAAGKAALTVTARYGRWIKLVPLGGEPLVLTVRDLGLASDPNLRDIGGYRTTDGQWVRMGVVYRSQALSLSSADLANVDTLGITSDFDLRTPAEIAASPDVVPAGATYTNLNVLGDSSASISGVTSAAQAEAYMQEGEREFVTGASAQQAFGTLLSSIANGDGAALYHCSAGKDRTGWATAVILTLLGVPEQTVMRDYLLSNTYYFDSAAVQAELAAMPAAEAAVYTPFMEVEPSYLQAGFDQVKQSYGSMYEYAVKGLGLSPQTIAKLRARLLVG